MAYYRDVKRDGNKPHKKVSRRLKVCTSCNRVYETEYSTKKTLYYEDFPTLGLERKLCKRHKGV